MPDVYDIISWRQGFIGVGAGTPTASNQTRAAKTELCAGAVLGSDWQATLRFDACFDNCTATYCPQPAANYMTDAKAKSCAPPHTWTAIAACRDGAQGTALLTASLAEAQKLRVKVGPTTYINGKMVGHHPDAAMLQAICAAYTGTPPKGCT